MPGRARVSERLLLEEPLSDYTQSVNALVYGLPGCGKTTFSASAPNASHWNLEPGIVSAVRAGGTGGLVRLHSFIELKRATAMAERGEFSHRDWIILDTISTGQNWALNESSDRGAAENPKRDADVPAVQDYLKAQNGIKRVVERLVELPVNCLFLAHALYVENGNEDGDAIWLPSIQGGADKGYPVANYVMALMNVVGFMQVTENKAGEQVHRTLWQSYYDADKGIRYTAKDQYGVLGTYSDNTTGAEFAARIAGAKPSKAKKTKKKEQ